MSDSKQKVLEIFSKSTNPLKAKEIAEQGNLDPKEVAKQITALKKEGLLESPKNCYYQIKK
ncbi:MAG: Rrf2 family transcriptional regulator [Candidatus Cloacimonetes bacterium]|nr:Rrf2 family transcriptional regulator [Candidatus Cloacimonadota bacterium]